MSASNVIQTNEGKVVVARYSTESNARYAANRDGLWRCARRNERFVMSKAINNAMAVALHTVKSYNSSPKGDGKRRARRASRRAGKALANGAS